MDDQRRGRVIHLISKHREQDVGWINEAQGNFFKPASVVLVFGNRMKHSFECLKDTASQTIVILGEIQSKSSPNLMIIEITFPNLPHRSDFL